MWVGECHLLDVGQGSSNVILLGQGRAIVIDCPQGSQAWNFPTIRLLERSGVDFLEVIAVTHNDVDHSGGIAGIVTAYSGRIGRICLLQDRRASGMRLFASLMTEVKLGRLEPSQILRLETDDGGVARTIWQDADRMCRLVVAYPDFTANVKAQARGETNATSAVLLFQCPGGLLVFPGDCTIEGWRAFHAARGGLPITCDVLAVPHHGGLLGETTLSGETEPLQWLYRTAISPKAAIVSVGTANQYGHPNADHIRALRDAGAVVMCTQITSSCCDDLDQLRPGVLPPCRFSLSAIGPPRTSSGRAKNVACAGTVVAELAEERIRLPGVDRHQQTIDSCDLLSPLCRP